MNAADECKAFMIAIVQAFMMISTWAFILASYWNQVSPPPVIWGTAIVVASLYGIALVGPIKNLIKKSFRKVEDGKYRYP